MICRSQDKTDVQDLKMTEDVRTFQVLQMAITKVNKKPFSRVD